MEEMSKHGHIGQAAMKSDMDRKTARKYVAGGKLPSELATIRDWRTRPDPFEQHWPEIEERLRVTPELEAKTLFDLLQEQHPERYEDGQLRTLQRRVRWWRAARGPEQEIVLGQEHRPGEAAQTDFTRTAELAVTIAGQVFVHLLCMLVLPFSNWQWVTVCLSESMAALRKGVQRSLFQLGRVPRYHQTDNSTAATHRIPDGQAACFEDGKRPFNADYLALMQYFGMTPRTTTIGAKEQNGDSSPPTARSSGGSSRPCWCEAAATSRASMRGRTSSTRSDARPTPIAASVSPRISPRCASSPSRSCPSIPRKSCASAIGARYGSSTAPTRCHHG